MTTAIWKATLEVTDEQPLLLPPCRFLSVDVQRGVPCIWFLVPDTDVKPTIQHVYMAGTGQPCGRLLDKRFVGAFQMYDVGLVFHVFVDA